MKAQILHATLGLLHAHVIAPTSFKMQNQTEITIVNMLMPSPRATVFCVRIRRPYLAILLIQAKYDIRRKSDIVETRSCETLEEAPVQDRPTPRQLPVPSYSDVTLSSIISK